MGYCEVSRRENPEGTELCEVFSLPCKCFFGTCSEPSRGSSSASFVDLESLRSHTTMTAIALRLATLGSLLGLAVAAGHDHDGHDHEAHGESEMGFEWAGIFATPESIYMWTAQKVNGAYADPAMKLVALPATDITEAGLHALEEEGKHSMEKNCTEVEAGETIVPAEDTCYHLHFQADAWQTLFNVDASGVSGIAFFAEHVPTEFEATAHYLKDSVGEDIEPVAQLPEANTEATATATGLEAAPIVAAILVNIITFIGVVLLFPPLRRAVEKPVFSAMLFAFASGALLACAFFLLLFEATHLIGVGWQLGKRVSAKRSWTEVGRG